MPESITCPHCRRLLEVPPGHLGRELRCPQCQTVFTAMTGTGITADAPRASSSSQAIQPGPPRHTTRRSTEPNDDTDDEYELAARRRPFRAGGALVVVLKALLFLNLLLFLVWLASDYMDSRIAGRLIVGEPVPLAEERNAEVRQVVLVALFYILRLATAIAFLVWFYRVYDNLGPLRARSLAYTPGRVVMYWFVPVLNLVGPVLAAQEIWRHSDPEAVLDPDGASPARRNSALVGWWWAMWLISGVLNMITYNMGQQATTPERFLSAVMVSMVADVAWIIASVLALAVVATIDARQTARAAALGIEVGPSFTQP